MTRLSLDLSLRLSPRPIQSPKITLPPGVWGQALHDFESPDEWPEDPSFRPMYFRDDLGYPVPRSLANPKDRLNDAKGFPEMVPGDPRVGVKLTKRIQWFIVKLFVLSKYGILLIEDERQGKTFESEFKRLLTRAQQDYIKNAWRGHTKSFTAFTNQRGTDNCIDYINGVTNGSNELPVLWENVTGGTLLRLESLRVYRQGYKILALKTSDYLIWRNWTPYDHPGYFTDPTNSTPYALDGKTLTLRGPWRADRFHYLGGSAPVWTPIMSNTGFFYIRKNRIRILKQGEPFPPRSTNP